MTALGEVRNGCELAFSQGECLLINSLAGRETVNDDDIDHLYQDLLQRLSRYAKRLSANLKLDDTIEAFKGLTYEEKRGVILGIATIANAENRMVDLSALGKAKTAGQLKMTFSKEMTNAANGFAFIDQSVTGMFEKRQSLEL